MTASVILSDTFGNFKDKANELIVMTQAGGMLSGNPIKLQDSTQSTSNTTGSIITAGGVGIAKDVIIGGSVNVHGNLHANGNITSDGSLTFGDAATDNVVFAADVNSHIIPNTDDTYDLGSTGQRWRTVYLNGNIDLNDSDNILFGIGNDMSLYHDGTNSYITNATGALKVATETSGIAVSIGHTTSETTINDNLIVTGKINGPLKVGVDDTGHDVTFFGATTGQYMKRAQAQDELILALDAKLSFWDAAGGENIIATSDGHLEINAGTTLDITAPTVDINVSTTLNVDGVTQLTGAVTVGVDGTGHDVRFFGATSGKYMLWNQAADVLQLPDSTSLDIGNSSDLSLVHDGTNSYIKNAVGALKIATETSGIAVTIGHTTSETTIGHNLTISGNLTVSGTTTTVTTDTIRMYDKNIEIGVVGSPSDTTADGGGLTLKGASDKTITWVNSTDSWDFNQHIFPSADDTLDLGSTAKKWQDLHIAGNINAIPVSTLATIGDVMALSIALG